MCSPTDLEVIGYENATITTQQIAVESHFCCTAGILASAESQAVLILRDAESVALEMDQPHPVSSQRALSLAQQTTRVQSSGVNSGPGVGPGRSTHATKIT